MTLRVNCIISEEIISVLMLMQLWFGTLSSRHCTLDVDSYSLNSKSIIIAANERVHIVKFIICSLFGEKLKVKGGFFFSMIFNFKAVMNVVAFLAPFWPIKADRSASWSNLVPVNGYTVATMMDSCLSRGDSNQPITWWIAGFYGRKHPQFNVQQI